MKNEGNNNSPRGGGGGARVLPKRGQVKVRIFTEAAKKVKAAVRVGFLNKKKGDGFDTEFKAMEGKAVKKTKANCLLPPKRGQIKVKIIEEIVETVVTITRPSRQTKNIPDDVLARAGAAAVKPPENCRCNERNHV
ncbi:hypothetical protein LWI29_019695 [Acer saccharum]|uniref:Uncharacterized protein n=1 Tax=Acer saccharum TaxID=4024 RepID=A0AA39VTV5_ACESA|nr:hypothetical protein LWI29_019695 [Acer saccharum]